MFLDVHELCCGATNDALEYIFKSVHEHDDGIWNPHESLLIRRLVELFTNRGIERMAAVKDQLIAWEAGAYYKEVPVIPVPPGYMQRWTEHELALVKLYLESMFPGDWSVNDHMLAVDYICQRYLPHEELRMEADWLSTRATLMGKVQANIDEQQITTDNADKILEALPSSIPAADAAFSLSPAHKKVMEFAGARCAENVQAISESVRHRVRGTVIKYLEEKESLPAGTPSPSLETMLFDEFAVLNRDWRRIAVTEAGEAQNQGFISSLKSGSKVQRSEYYQSACAFCKKIHKVIATVVSPDHQNKNPDTMVWPGKNNIGRSASPRKRVGNLLVFREPDEMWWLPAGLAHPHCRGRWIKIADSAVGDDPDFAEWLKKTLS